ncbi:hypothetical protein [Nonomuraea maritima]|uniref:hypothetical protein n=1 Tax=Nonomuraea maritima TaxID=683260 RepID=UPI00372045C3
MTRYAVDPVRNALVAHWSTGIGDVATDVAALPCDRDALRLANCLTYLSQVCWRCYTHPAGAADQHGPHSVGWHRQRERDSFAQVLPTLVTPGARPSATRIEQAAHRVGSVLRTMDAPRLAAAVTADVTDELAAVERAELGDLSARAQQAVVLSREDASPLQVAQADTLLHEHPFGNEALVTQVEPTAAAIAAAHWLYAAATVTARRTGLHPAQTATRADRVKALAQESSAEVVAAMSTGASARQVVMPLIRHTLHLAEGHLHGVAAAKRRIDAAEELIARANADHRDLDLSLDAVYLPITSLNPARPAPDLVENLLSGIHSCWILYCGRDAVPRQHRRTEAFVTELRDEAARRREALL